MLRAVRYIFIGALAGFIPVFLLISLIVEPKLGLIIGLLVGLISGLFSLGFMQRVLAQVAFEINMQNKAFDRGMSWYEERVREQINHMGFAYDRTEGKEEIFKPRALHKLFQPEVRLEVDTYYIHVVASRLMVRLIATYVEIPE